MKLQISQEESSGREQSVFLTLPPETECFKHSLLKYSNRRGDMSRIIIGMSMSFCGSSDIFTSDVRSKNPELLRRSHLEVSFEVSRKKPE